MKWIRVEVATPDHPVVHELAEALGVRQAQAVGHFTALCCRMGEHQEDGMLANVTDATLETWALWGGKRGRFAAALRARCQDEDGRLHGWWRQDKLRERAEKDRERKRNSGGIPVEPPRNDGGIPRSPARALAPSRQQLVVGEDSSPPEGVRGNLPDTSRDAFDTFYREADRPHAYLAELGALEQGLRGAAYPWPVIGRALEEMAAAGGGWNPRRMQAFCRKIAAGDPPAKRGGSDFMAGLERIIAEGGTDADAA